MVAELKDYIKVYDGMVEDKLCDKIIEAFESTGYEFCDREQRPSFNELNITQLYKKEDPIWKPLKEKVMNRFIDATELYIQDLDVDQDFPQEYAFEEFRIKMYRNNEYDEFRDHVDVGDYNSARRFLVCFLYLNDVGAGGYTNFPKLNHAITPKRGRILLFPSTWQYRHSGQQPITNNKYIVGSYQHYV